MRFENNRYILYTKDRPLLAFICDRDAEDNPIFVETYSYDEMRPFHYTDIGSWIQNRRAPKHRAHIKEILDRYNCNDLEGFVRFTYCAGLNDTFWIRPEELSITWQDISLYRNEFSETIARLAFGTSVAGEEFTTTTPEFGTDGTFPKCWKRFCNEIYLLKQGSSGAVNAGREPYSEALTYEISRQICADPVPYDLIRFHKKLASRCRLFTSEDIGYAPAVAFLSERASLKDMVYFFDSIGSGDEFRQMIVLDALTLNTDRHMKNFGVLYENDTMQIKKMAPVFDNNLSLCPYAEIEDLKNIDEYMATRESAIGDGFNEAALYCMTAELKQKLEKMREFHFNHEMDISLPEERLVLLEHMVHKQAENLLHERLITIPLTEPEEAELTSMQMTINSQNLTEKSREALLSQKFDIQPFSVIMQSGDILQISNCAFTVNVYGENVEIDVYDCTVEGKTSDVKVATVNGLQFTGELSAISLPIDVDIQMDRGRYSHTNQIRICVAENDKNIAKSDQRQTADPCLIVLCGLPGSGRDEYETHLREEMPADTCYIAFQDEPAHKNNNHTDNSLTTEQIKKQIEQSLREGKSVICNAPNIFPENRKQWIEAANACNIRDCRLVVFDTDKETALVNCIQADEPITAGRMDTLIRQFRKNQPTPEEGWTAIQRIHAPQKKLTQEQREVLTQWHDMLSHEGDSLRTSNS